MIYDNEMRCHVECLEKQVQKLEQEVEELKEQLRIAERSRESDCVVSDLYRDELQTLKEKARWRSVEDELPEHHEYVACLNNSGKKLCAYWDADKKFFVDHRDCFRDVKHWLPLPALPQEGGQGE